ncbi:MAG: hypothetical protein ACLTR6_16580 [Clostridium fessum]
MDENGACPGRERSALSVAVAFTALAAQTFQITASIGSCLIGSGQNTVDISLSSNGDTTGTDGKIYLSFELRTV